MKTTVVIPCYNQAEYLPEAIDSALAQTVPCEIIVVNDGSTDKSLEIAKSYESKGVKVINQVNKGLASARNTGIMNMTGEYFFPLDSDDIMLETCIEKIEEAAKEHNSDVIAPSFKAFGVQNAELVLGTLPTIQDFLIANRLGYFSAIKKSVLLEVGGYNPRMSIGYEDWDLWLDIFKREKSICLLPNILVLYRTKVNSMLTEADKHRDLLVRQMMTNHPELYKKP